MRGPTFFRAIFLAFARHSTVIIQQQIMFFKGKLKLKIKYDQVSAANHSVKNVLCMRRERRSRP